MDEGSIPLIAFSYSRRHYDWIVMPFDLKTAPRYSKEEWITFLKILVTIN